MTDLPLATSEARDVLAAVVARVAADSDLDLLLIKGPSLTLHGLRGERAWGDVDVLVRPDHVSPLRRVLATSGWHPFNETPDFPLITLPHAVTLVHPRWHTEIDLHTFVPGCYASPAMAFERLWAERTRIELGHQPVPCTGPLGSALVGALNLVRAPGLPRTATEMPDWQAAVSSWSYGDRSALARLAAQCGAADVLAPLFDDVGVPSAGRGTIAAADWDDWQDRVGREVHPGYAWAAAMRRAPIRHKARLALRALTYDPIAASRGLPQPTGASRVRHALRRLILVLTVRFRRPG